MVSNFLFYLDAFPGYAAGFPTRPGEWLYLRVGGENSVLNTEISAPKVPGFYEVLPGVMNLEEQEMTVVSLVVR